MLEVLGHWCFTQIPCPTTVVCAGCGAKLIEMRPESKTAITAAWDKARREAIIAVDYRGSPLFTELTHVCDNPEFNELTKYLSLIRTIELDAMKASLPG